VYGHKYFPFLTSVMNCKWAKQMDRRYNATQVFFQAEIHNIFQIFTPIIVKKKSKSSITNLYLSEIFSNYNEK